MGYPLALRFPSVLQAQAAPFTPADFPGLTSWLSAKDLSGQADGTDVTTWADKSGNNRDWGSDGTRALPDKETVGGFPAVEFDDTGPEGLTEASLLSAVVGDNGLTAIVLEVQDTPATNGGDYWLNETAFADEFGNRSIGFRNDGAGGTIAQFAIWDGAAKVVEVALTAAARHVLLMRRDAGGTLYGSVDGGAEQTLASGAPSDQTDPMFLGGQGPGNAPEFDGYLHELVTSTSNGTAQERSDLIDYLKNEWSIA